MARLAELPQAASAAIESLDAIAGELRRLARAHFETGNLVQADRMAAMAAAIEGDVRALRDLRLTCRQ